MKPRTRGSHLDKRPRERIELDIVLVKSSCGLANRFADLDSIFQQFNNLLYNNLHL